MEKDNYQKLLKNRIRKLNFLVFVSSHIPFVRCLILNGSMAYRKITPESDIDILIITKRGRIFTVRFLINSIFSILFLKRSNNENKRHGGKFCFNYFMAENNLSIPHDRSEEMNRYCAENYSHSIFLYGDKKLFEKFQRTNSAWMRKIIGRKTLKFNKIMIKNRNFEKSFGYRLEKKISKKSANRFEKKVKAFQIKKIYNDPRTKFFPDLIAVNDNELRFHPPKKIIKKALD